jgi:hypothetical protein
VGSARAASARRLLKKSFGGDFVSGHDFRRAAKSFIFCHPERALAREGSAFLIFQQVLSAGDTRSDWIHRKLRHLRMSAPYIFAALGEKAWETNSFQ